MEEIEKSFKFLSDCAEIAQKLKENHTFNTPVITITIPPRDYPHLLHEIEEFVEVSVDRKLTTISLIISGTQFIFNRENN